mmetsp:Transcript_35945/g.113709  ORF Transcript_35945/g.113709 Transcript_35945/m.113709 type:complete len:83 (-) Transcript_35945:21-269(-)
MAWLCPGGGGGVQKCEPPPHLPRAYIYFMMTQRDMSYETMMQRMESKYKQEGYTGRNFDIHQYNKLTSSVRKLEAMARKAPK